MTDALESFEAYKRRGIVAQIALSLFVGVPATFGLAVALAAYCAFQCVIFPFRTKPQAIRSIKHASEESFTSSLSKLASVHGPTAKIERSASRPTPQSAFQKDDVPAESKLYK